MLRLSHLKNKHFLVLSGNGMLSAVGLGIAALLFHSLTPAQVGTWFFVQSLIGFCEAARSGFLSTAAVKFYAGTTPERGRTVLGSVWYLALIITGIVVLANACAVPAIPHIRNEEMLLCVEWIGITFLATLPSDVISWKLQAEERYGTMLLFGAIKSICTVVSFGVLIIFHQMTLEKAFFFNLIINVATSLIGLLLGLGGLRYIRHRTRECVTEVAHYGKFTLGTTIGAHLLGNVDTWIINFLLGPASVAIYNLAQRLMAFVELPLRSFSVTGMSAMAIAYNKDHMDRVAYIFRKYAGMLTWAFLPMSIAALLFGDEALAALGGADYTDTEAANCYKLIMFIALIYPIERLNGVTLDIIHETRVNFYKVMIMISLKVAGDFVGLLIFHNIYGVVMAIFLAHLTALLYGNYKLQKHIKYTIPGLLSTGYTEMRQLIRLQLR